MIDFLAFLLAAVLVALIVAMFTFVIVVPIAVVLVWLCNRPAAPQAVTSADDAPTLVIEDDAPTLVDVAEGWPFRGETLD